MQRKWIEAPKPLPGGVARGWIAIEGGFGICAIFQVIAGDTYMCCYHVLGEPKPRIEKFPSFTMAQEHANASLSNCKVIPRRLPETMHASNYN